MSNVQQQIIPNLMMAPSLVPSTVPSTVPSNVPLYVPSIKISSLNINRDETGFSIIGLIFLLLTVITFVITCVIVGKYSSNKIIDCMNNGELLKNCKIYIFIILSVILSIIGIIMKAYYLFTNDPNNKDNRLENINIAANIFSAPIFLGITFAVLDTVYDLYKNV